ncbi:MAG: type 4a pilus biogenesis protein PilO [Candidatus Omnitrophota bacterium]
MPNEPKIQKSNNIVLITVGMVILTLAVGVLIVYFPFLAKYKTISNKIMDERNRNLLIAEIGVTEKYLDFYERRLSGDKGITWLLKEVSGLAATESIKIVNIKPLDSEKKKDYTRLSLKLETISTYYQLGKLVSSIESSEKFLVIDKIDIKRLDSMEMYGDMEEKHKPFDIYSDIIISTVAWRE